MKKVAFLVLHLGYGGAESAVISEANLLSEFCKVEIFCTYKLLEEPAFKVKSDVKITYLSDLKPNRAELAQAIRSKNPIAVMREGFKSIKVLYQRRALMKKAVKKCDADIIISSRYLYHKLLTDNAKKGTLCVAQEHNHHNGNEKYISKQLKSVEKMDYFMPVSKELTDFYSKRLSSTVKCKYIPHHLESFPEENSPLTGKNLISVGRLSPEKGMDELIDIFARLNRLHSDWKLHIVGDGEQKPFLAKMIKDLHLENSVILHGFKSKKEIAPLMMESSVYVMTSHTESFGLVLIEAQSYGVPCVAFDSAQGANEILKNGENGILIGNRSHSDMVSALNKLITDFDYRAKIGSAGRMSAEKYTYSSVKQQWFDFISQKE